MGYHHFFLPALLPLAGFCPVSLDEAWLSPSTAPASCTPETQTSARQAAWEGRRIKGMDTLRRALWQVLTQKGETVTNSRIISASGQRLEGPQWCQKRVSNGIKCLSSLFVSYTSPCLLTLNLRPSSAVPNLEGVGWGRGGCTESWSLCCIHNFWGSLMETKTNYHPQKPCDRGCGVITQACQWGWWGVTHLTASLFSGAKIWP